jgi:hypothetical protein
MKRIENCELNNLLKGKKGVDERFFKVLNNEERSAKLKEGAG